MSDRVIRIAFLVPLAAALAASALGDTPASDSSRATIRGSGRDVTIVYRGGSATPARKGHASAGDGSGSGSGSEGVVGEAERLAARGVGDDAVIAYLRAHQAQLPPVVDAGAAKRLRKAGAGTSVLTELSRLAAVDIGPTAPDAVAVTAEYANTSYRYPSDDSGYSFAPGANGGYPGSPGYPFYGSGGSFFPRRHLPRLGPAHPMMGFPGRGGRPGFSARPSMNARAPQVGAARRQQF